MSTQATLLEQILSGTNRNLQVLAAQGLVPLPPDELLPIQVALTGSPDTEVAAKSDEALQRVDVRLAVSFVEQQAGERELHYFGIRGHDPAIVEAVIRRSDVAHGTLVAMAAHLAPDLQEVLIHRQDAIMEQPEILLQLEQNEQLSNYAKRRIWEYREHLLPKDKLPAKKPEEIEAEAEALTDEEMAEAIAEVQEKAEGKTEEVIDDLTGLTPAQVRLLPPPMRVKLARNADRQMRALLIRDNNSQVALAVLVSNALPDSEVEQIANSRYVCEEVLKEIEKKREWVRKYPIAKALVKNPKTQLASAIKLVPRMTVKDLRDLAKDKNVPDGVRTRALRLYQAKRG